MHKTLTLVLVLLFSAAWLQAQESSSSAASGVTTIQGCLQYSSGHYSLTDSSGTKYRLTGYANKLKSHVGHEVEITGTSTVHTTGTTMQGAASTATQHPALAVKTVKHIADTCTSPTK